MSLLHKSLRKKPDDEPEEDAPRKKADDSDGPLLFEAEIQKAVDELFPDGPPRGDRAGKAISAEASMYSKARLLMVGIRELKDENSSLKERLDQTQNQLTQQKEKFDKLIERANRIEKLLAG